jgi:hypothetical protein
VANLPTPGGFLFQRKPLSCHRQVTLGVCERFFFQACPQTGFTLCLYKAPHGTVNKPAAIPLRRYAIEHGYGRVRKGYVDALAHGSNFMLHIPSVYCQTERASRGARSVEKSIGRSRRLRQPISNFPFQTVHAVFPAFAGLKKQVSASACFSSVFQV